MKKKIIFSFIIYLHYKVPDGLHMAAPESEIITTFPSIHLDI